MSLDDARMFPQTSAKHPAYQYELSFFMAANRACVHATHPKDPACSLPCFAGNMLPAASASDT